MNNNISMETIERQPEQQQQQAQQQAQQQQQPNITDIETNCLENYEAILAFCNISV